MAQEYFHRTPTSTGNRKIFTYAGWFKKNNGNGSDRFDIFNAYNTGSQEEEIGFRQDALRYLSSGSSLYGFDTTNNYRDTGNWFHIVFALNTTLESERKRSVIYINGVEVDTTTSSGIGAYVAKNFDSIAFNVAGKEHNVLARKYSSSGRNYVEGGGFDIFFVDGQALTPDVFGFFKEGKGYQSSGTTQATDFRPGQWSPHSPRKIKTEIERKGGFGVNGFYLPMNDSSNFGADFHCTPNSIIKLKGEDLPQPRNGAPTTSDAYVSELREETGSLGFDGCVKFDGSSDYLSLANNADFSFNGDFTIEAFVYPTALNSFNTIFSTEDLDFKFISSGAVRIYTSAGSNTTGTIPLNQWSHVALVRQSSTFKVYINGNGETVSPPAFTGDGSSAAEIGRKIRNTSEELTGFISNLRVVKGTAVYTSNFTVPTEALTNVTNTKLLCCNSSTSATAATVSPGSITTNGNAFATRSELSGSIVLAVPGIATGNGSNLITNGNFDTDISGWSSGNSATLTHEFAGPDGSGSIKVASGTGSNGYAYRDLTGVTTVGQRYTLSFDYQHVSGPQGYFNVGNSTGASQVIYQNLGTSSSWQRYTFSFTATVTNQFIGFYSRYSSGVTRFANISLVQQDAPRDYSADIKGSGTNKTPTLSGRSGVGYELGGYYGSAYTSSSNDDYLEFPGTSGDFNVGTGDFAIEMWLNPDSTQATNARLFGQDGNSAGNWDVYIASTSASNQINMMGGAESLTGGDGSSYGNLIGDQWNHFCLERYNGQLTTYVNGVAVYTQSYTSSIGDNNPFRIGQIGSNVYGGITYGFNGEIQDFRFYKGVSKYKGGFDVPKPYTPVGIKSWRQVSDTCKNNFCTLNPLDTSQLSTSNGNSSIDQSSGGWHSLLGTHYVRSGKWYAEMRIDRLGWIFFGVDQTWLETRTRHIGGQTGSKGAGLVYNTGNRGDITYNGANNAYTGGDATAATGDIISIALDLDNNNIKFYKNNVLQYNLSNILESGADYAFGVSPYSDVAATVNFGQNPTFSGTVTAGTYTDSNGKGLFKYEPPSGFLALCEDNLPTPAVADPGEHFKCVLYRGDGTTGHSITGVGFKPDLVWLKERTSTSSHQWHDSVRGAGNVLFSNVSNAESYSATYLYSLDSDGFTLGTSGGVNASTDDYVAWCWKAGGAAVPNNDGSITSQVSANQAAGFSIVSYTGNYTAGATIGHGLGKKPSFMIVKERTGASGWFVYHEDLGATKFLSLHDVTAAGTETGNTACWYATEPDASVFTVGQNGATNENNRPIIAYCWTEIEGYSRFGSYLGNGNADGPFIYCGFKPAWIMIKPYGSGNGCYSGGYASWSIYDSSRSPVNNTTMHERVLFANRNYEEGKRGQGSASGTFQNIDILSNGFKIRGGSNCETNTTSVNGFIFVAFAESPFQTANAK